MTSRDPHPITPAEAYWDAEFAEGRLLDLPPEHFVDDILAAARAHGLLPGPGLYIGPGNGRNYLPLVAGGLDLIGLDVSSVGLAAIAAQAPDRADRLVHGDLGALPPDASHPVVVGIQVFHHGTGEEARAHLRAALERTAPGGLFCARVNAVGSTSPTPTEVVATDPDGSTTVRYLDREDFHVHYFSEPGLSALLAGFDTVMPVTPDDRPRPDGHGRFRRLNVIVRRPA